MSEFIDGLLESGLSGLNLKVNIVVAALVLVFGIIMLVLGKKNPSKGKKIAGVICTVVGCLGIVANTILLFMI